MKKALKGFKQKKGFIGPIGDDLPSIIAILLGLSLFFSGLSFTLNVYNHKLTAYNILKGTMEVAHKVNDKGIIDASSPGYTGRLKNSAKNIAKSYGISFCIKTKVKNQAKISCTNPHTECGEGWLHFKYLVAYETTNGVLPGSLEVCGG